ncbi:type I 3-dehydroquinate dehydratase, partial [Acinetobacter baumannii]|nr:type I 3-dehydroquinate dehydratase [Acinetobacter baumannii]
MNMKTLLSLSLLALPFFTAQVNAEPVALAAQAQ